MLAVRAGPGSCPENPSTSSCPNPSRVSPPAFWFPRGPPTSGPCDSTRDKACGVKPGRVVAPSRRNLVEYGPRLHGRRESGVHEGLPCILSVSLRPKLTEEALETTAESRSCARGFLPGGGRVGSAPRGRPVRAPGGFRVISSDRSFWAVHHRALAGAFTVRRVDWGVHPMKMANRDREICVLMMSPPRSFATARDGRRNDRTRGTDDASSPLSRTAPTARSALCVFAFVVPQRRRMRSGLTSASRGPSSGAAPRDLRCR